jgi:NADH-quinone oxidoreductase subunit M
MLWLYQRVFFGRASADVTHHMYDMNAREWACMVPLIVMMVWMGCFTQSFMPPITTATSGILEKTRTTLELHVQIPKLEARNAR